MLKRTLTAALAALALGASSVFGAGGAKADGNDIIGPIIIGAAIGGLIIAATQDDRHHAYHAPKRRYDGHGRYKRHANKRRDAYRSHNRSRVQAYSGHRGRAGHARAKSSYMRTERRRVSAQDEIKRRRARARDNSSVKRQAVRAERGRQNNGRYVSWRN